MEQVRLLHYKCDDFKVEGEVFKGKYFLHINVNNYSHNVQKKIELLFEEMKTAALSVGFPDKFYAILPNEKYAEYMGGTKIGELNNKGEKLGVFKWDLM